MPTLNTELGGDRFTSLLDVRDEPDFDKVMHASDNVADGRLNILFNLFNIAGIAVFGLLDGIPFEKLVDAIKILLLGVLNGIFEATFAFLFLSATPLPCWELWHSLLVLSAIPRPVEFANMINLTIYYYIP